MRSDAWSAVDGLGRTLPTFDQVGPVRKDRFVGMFYFGWHSELHRLRPLNISRFIAKHPDAKYDYDHPAWKDPELMGGCAPKEDAPFGMQDFAYFWNEPLFGYYSGEDEWVIRRHGEMLADAGVDVIIFDSSNLSILWEKSFDAIARVWSRMREEGTPAPYMSYLLNFGPCRYTRDDLIQLRRWFREKPLAERMWFRWEGKPLVLGYPQSLTEEDGELKDFFTFRPCQPSYFHGAENGAKWGWLSVYPQKVYMGEDGQPEQITVGCSQNASEESAAEQLPSAFSSGERLFGRNYTQRHGEYAQPAGMLYGKNFEEQWERALKVDPKFVFVTSWNEWLAGREREWSNGKTVYPNATVDTYNDNLSRDIEPSRGILRDHFYYQLVANVRRYKGCEPPEKRVCKTICLNGGGEQWDDVPISCQARPGHGIPRHADGYLGYHYDNDTCRNELKLAKVTGDGSRYWFYAEAFHPLTANADERWMRLFIRTHTDAPNWEGMHYAVGLGGYGEQVGLYRCLGGWNWEFVCCCDYVRNENCLTVEVPAREMGNARELDFKWIDNMIHEGDILDVYQYGDALPPWRFMASYGVE